MRRELNFLLYRNLYICYTTHRAAVCDRWFSVVDNKFKKKMLFCVESWYRVVRVAVNMDKWISDNLLSNQ